MERLDPSEGSVLDPKDPLKKMDPSGSGPTEKNPGSNGFTVRKLDPSADPKDPLTKMDPFGSGLIDKIGSNRPTDPLKKMDPTDL